MAPIIVELRNRSGFQPIVCTTGQHRQMLDQVMSLFDLKADIDLDLMRPNQTLNALTGRIFSEVDAVLERVNPDIVLTHGDTSTAMATSLAAFHRRIPVGHVEAGLRTYDLERPFPEEMNRRVIDLTATYLFAPSEIARANLVSERANPQSIHVTGNTVVDALLAMRAKIDGDRELLDRLNDKFPSFLPGRIRVLVTGHRRESFGDGFNNICEALIRISRDPEVEIVYPVHLNPNVQEPVRRLLANVPNIRLFPPVDYLDFVHLLTTADVIVTDSGGVQEEAISLGKSVLVMREVTERPEGVKAGLAHLVGVDSEKIYRGFAAAVAQLRTDSGRVRQARHIYGDGHAAARIVDILSGRRIAEFKGDIACAP